MVFGAGGCSESNPVVAPSSSDAASAGSRPAQLSREDSLSLAEIAKVLDLSEEEKAILGDLLERNLPAVKPLLAMVTGMEPRLAPYVKDGWSLFSGKLTEQYRQIKGLETPEKADLKERLAALKHLYEINLSHVAAESQVSYLLGYTDSAGKALTDLKITATDSTEAVTEVKALEKTATSFRAMATYEGSKAKRDVSHLAKWVVTQSPSGPVTQNPQFPYSLTAASHQDGMKLKASLGIDAPSTKTHEVLLRVVPAVSTSFSMRVVRVSNGNLVESLPAGVNGQLQLIATIKDSKGSIVNEFNVTDGATWKIEGGQEGKGKFLDQVKEYRSGYFAGFDVGKKVRVSAVLKGQKVLTDEVAIDPPEVSLRFYPGLRIDVSKVSELTDQITCPTRSKKRVQLWLAYPDYYGVTEKTLTGMKIHPGLHEFMSNCDLKDISKQAKFKVKDAPDDAILKDTSGGFTAHRASKSWSEVTAFWDDASGKEIATANVWVVTFEDRVLSKVSIEKSTGYYGWSSCKLTNGNLLPPFPILGPCVTPEPGSTESCENPDGSTSTFASATVVESAAVQQMTLVHHLQLFADWNDCGSKALEYNDQGLPLGVISLELIAAKEALSSNSYNDNTGVYVEGPTAALVASFGTGRGRGTLTALEGRPSFDMLGKVKAEFDFSHLCYNPDGLPNHCGDKLKGSSVLGNLLFSAAPPVINNGMVQRSHLGSIKVTFASDVEIASGAFVVRQNDGATEQQPGRIDALSVESVLVSLAVVNGRTEATLTFEGAKTTDLILLTARSKGPYKVAGNLSLTDGVWDLRIDKSKVTDRATGLSKTGEASWRGNKDIFKLFRLKADLNGDGRIGDEDSKIITDNYNSQNIGDPFIDAIDFEEDGRVGSAEVGYLKYNYNKSIF